ncbi:SCO family protein [Actinomadura rubrisoli]|uniref:SCO family protein n=1 Tax=Actinomadura rubrisoli TaxID=2530368 RepID=A0A4R5BV59_9ACTN|nr:SCO family protein [Actinomadura rubrisoli]TDD91001.1 SCO family protein [Actinomadura rubrisoli]
MRVSARPARPPRPALAGLGLAAVLLSAAACGGESAPVTIADTAPASPYKATALPGSYKIPDVTMTDMNGRPYDLPKRTRGKVALLFFGFTNCPDICPTTMADAAGALSLLSPAQRAGVQVVFITADPARDTPRALKDYLGRFDKSFVGLTGPWKSIEKAAGIAKAPVSPAPAHAKGNYQVQHGSNVMAYGPDGSGRLLFRYQFGSADMAKDLKTLLANEKTAPSPAG